MRRTKGAKALAFAVGVALALSACGGSDSDSSTEDTTSEDGAATGETVMTITYDIADEAVWEDGSPITYADFECSWQAALNTPGSISTSGYDKISSVAAGESDKQVVVSFTALHAPYKNLFSGLIKKAAVADCSDISADFQTSINYSGTEWKMDSWSKDQVVFVPNESYWGPRKASGKLVMVPGRDTSDRAQGWRSRLHLPAVLCRVG